MPRTLRELEIEALQLPVEDRGQLAARLLESLEPSDAEIQQRWIQEAERRAEEMRSGEVRGVLETSGQFWEMIEKRRGQPVIPLAEMRRQLEEE